MNQELQHERLIEALDYDKETGIFTWKIKPRNAVYVGDVAGHRNKITGYCSIIFDKKYYPSHRLAWFYVTKNWPDVIDHIDGNRANNAFVNLRNGDVKLNAQNKRNAQRNNKSGFLGVEEITKGLLYRARIRAGKQLIQLGCYKTPEEAHKAYLDAKREHHAGCTI